MKCKVLFLIHTLQVGGAEKVLINLVNNMDKKKFDITVMTVIDTGAFRNELASNITYKSIYSFKDNKEINGDSKSGNLLGMKKGVKKLLLKIYQFYWRHANCTKIYNRHITDNYDVEIAFLEGVTSKIIACSQNKKSKKYAWIHVDLINENKTDKFFNNLEEQKQTYNKFDKIIAVSEIAREQFINKYDFDKEKVIVKYNPIDAKNIEKMSKIEKIKKEKITLCAIGRLSPQKAFDRLLRISKRLNEKNINFNLWIIGVGEDEQKLKKYISDNNLSNVYLLGYKKNPYPYIKNADIIVCSSIAEGFSTVISEAIVLEKPIITTDCSGMRELLGNSKYGIICENNEESLYNEIYKILTNDKEYIKLKKMVIGRKKIFDMKKSVREVEKLME